MLNTALTHDPVSCTAPRPGAILQAAGLCKTYRGTAAPALAGLDLEVGGGEIFGLLGPNGAGKTTAISVMSTLLRPSAGSLTICGLDALRQPRRVRSLIGVVPQHLALFENLTARENLTYFGRMAGLGGARLQAAVQEGLEMTGLSERADQLVRFYSGGMKRRANLAAGMLHRPSLLFLDEPTVGIDPQSRNLIFESLLKLKDGGMTMIYTTHYMEEAQQLCGRIAVIDGGRLVALGNPAQLIEQHGGCRDLGELFLKLTGRRLRD